MSIKVQLIFGKGPLDGRNPFDAAKSSIFAEKMLMLETPNDF